MKCLCLTSKSRWQRSGVKRHPTSHPDVMFTNKNIRQLKNKKMSGLSWQLLHHPWCMYEPSGCYNAWWCRENKDLNTHPTHYVCFLYMFCVEIHGWHLPQDWESPIQQYCKSTISAGCTVCLQIVPCGCAVVTLNTSEVHSALNLFLHCSHLIPLHRRYVVTISPL